MTRNPCNSARHGQRYVLAVTAVVAAAMALAGCASPGSRSTGDPNPNLLPLATATNLASGSPAAAWHAMVRSHQKIFGLSVNGAPASIAPVRAIAKKVHKTPQIIEYYQDWADSFDPTTANRACAAGIVPALTWESWDWSDTKHGAVAVTQPDYAPRRIATGSFDPYISATAAAIKSVQCTIMLRFDQEPNGGWYPWGVGTAGMRNTAAQYVAMWHRVWTIFHRANVQNVIWCWSPNILSRTRSYPLRALYPGNRYVDVVGLDGYLYRRHDTPHMLFDPLMAKLKRFAATKPWFVAETGVSTTRKQPRGITRLLHSVAADSRLQGLVYLDEPAHRADWSFDSHPAALRAFRRGIGVPVYGHASG